MGFFARTLAALFTSAAAITVTLLAIVMVAHPGSSGLLRATWLVFRTVLGISALGMFLLLPLAALLIRRGMRFRSSVILLAIVGTMLGFVLLIWAPKNIWIGGVAGAVTVAIWAAFNRRLFSFDGES